jgi:hypothetical protein
MPTLTIRNVPDDVVDRLKAAARKNGHSMEQEVRELLKSRYTTRGEIALRVREQWKEMPSVPASEIDDARHIGRP